MVKKMKKLLFAAMIVALAAPVYAQWNMVPDMNAAGSSTARKQTRRNVQQPSSPSSFSPRSWTSEQRAAHGMEGAEIHTQLALMYFNLGERQTALEELMVALAFDKNYPNAYAVRGVIHSSLGQDDKAETDFNRAISLSPNSPEINDQYGAFLCKINKTDAAFRHFKVALEDPLYRTPGSVHYNAGICSLKVSKTDQAMDYFLKTVTMGSPYSEMANVRLADLLYHQNNLGESRIYLEEAMRQMEPPSAEALWLGIRLERREGQKTAENSYAARLRKNYPSSEEYKKYLKGEFE